MKVKRLALLTLVLSVTAVPAPAQLGLPPVGNTVGQTLDRAGRTLGQVDETLQGAATTAQSLAEARIDRLAGVVRRNRDSIERDAAGDPARKGELLLIDPQPGAEDIARRAGFSVIANENLGELGITVTRLAIPSGMNLAKAQARLAGLLPDATISSDTLNFTSGATAHPDKAPRSPAKMPPISTPVGVIDGAAGSGIPVAETRGFARGAPAPSNHGTAVASLLRHAGVQRVFMADVYGKDPAAGNALAVARALDWLVGKDIRVISISLVGPANPVVARAVSAAQRRGTVIVAAVGNDGPAAPPAYPASYPGVIAVTAVDGRNRALIEAGRALHLDYAAPGADMLAANTSGRWVAVRGTSFATPFVASRVALAFGQNMTTRINAEAIDLGAPGPDTTYGKGLLCVICRRTR